MAGTFGRADLYGAPNATNRNNASPVAVNNVNGAGVAPMSQAASGGGVSGGTAPAVSWVGLVAAIIMLRVMIHLADKAD